MTYNRWFPVSAGPHGKCVALREVGNSNPLIAQYGNEYQIGEGNLPFVPGWHDAQCDDKFQYVCQQAVGSFTGKISAGYQTNPVIQ